MDPNAGNNESVNDGIFSAVAEANHETYQRNGTPDKAITDPASTGQTGGGTPTKTNTPTTDVDDEVEGDNANGLDDQDFSREIPVKEDVAEVEVPEQTNPQPEPQEVAEEFDWKQNLLMDPGDFTIERPKPDEYGQLDPLEYSKYLKAEVMHDLKVEAYNDKLITAAYDAVEKILPEVKSDPVFRNLIQNTFNSTLSGEETVNMAKSLRTSLDSIAGVNKAAGAQSAKTSITIQKNAALETKGATQVKADTSRADNLSKRLAKNDTTAFEELMGGWLEDGKI